MTTQRVVYEFTEAGYADMPPRVLRKNIRRERLCPSCIPPQVTITGYSHEPLGYEHALDCPTRRNG